MLTKRTPEGFYFDANIVSLLERLIDEILEHENLIWIDIEYFRPGSYSMVFGIGSKVLKIGAPRNCYNIPDDERLLRPLIRVNLSSLSTSSSVQLKL